MAMAVRSRNSTVAGLPWPQVLHKPSHMVSTNSGWKKEAKKWELLAKREDFLEEMGLELRLEGRT